MGDVSSVGYTQYNCNKETVCRRDIERVHDSHRKLRIEGKGWGGARVYANSEVRIVSSG